MAMPPAPAQQQKRVAPIVIGVIAVVLALCLIGVCALGAVALFLARGKDDGARTRAGGVTYPTPVGTATSSRPPVGGTGLPQREAPETEPAPPPAPARIGQCIGVSEDGDFLGIGNCNGSRGTYRVVSVDYGRGTCSDPGSPYITVNGYKLCLELHLVRFYCYKFPKQRGFVTAAPKCKAKGTVHIIDIVPGASNGDRCTRDYQWNRWYRFTHPTVVYCVMQY
jgi:hypothetical protein